MNKQKDVINNYLKPMVLVSPITKSTNLVLRFAYNIRTNQVAVRSLKLTQYNKQKTKYNRKPTQVFWSKND